MEFSRTSIPDVILVQPTIHRDQRGFFLETYRANTYAEGGIEPAFVQDNHSHSLRGALRGLHIQVSPPQGKLVRAAAGQIFDVAVDVRIGSPTYLQWVGVNLSDMDHHQLYLPPGFLHGFCVLSEEADVAYKCTDYYAAKGELTVAWDDPAIGIEWPISDPILSSRDAAAPGIQEIEERLPRYRA